jgi:hypothetical protein
MLGGMIKIYSLELPQDRLLAMPEAERVFLFGIAHIANEVNMLQKLFFWASNAPEQPEILKEVHMSQALMLAKMLAGKLHEFWKFIEKAYFKSRVSQLWESKFDDEAKIILKDIKGYFSNSNCLNDVRNKFAFHYSDEMMKCGFEKAMQEEKWKIYLSDTEGNSYYYAADIVAHYAMLEQISPGNHPKAIEKILDELNRIAYLVNEFAGQCWIVGVDLYLFPNDEKIHLVPHNVKDTPRMEDVQIPFFIQLPNKTVKKDSEKHIPPDGI